METDLALVRRVAEFGERYYDEHLLKDVRRRKTLFGNWLTGLNFWFDRAFYQGRRDEVSQMMEQRALEALNEVIGEDVSRSRDRLVRLAEEGWLVKDNWEKEDNPIHGKLLEGRLNKRYDRLLVLSSLALAVETGHLNIVRWAVEKVQRKELIGLYQRLDDVASVGDKIASFFLRDLVDVFDLRQHVKPQDRGLLQPVDIWVRHIANEVRIAKTGTDKELRSGILDTCDKAGVDPIRFNQGSWYVGFNATRIVLEVLKS